MVALDFPGAVMWAVREAGPYGGGDLCGRLIAAHTGIYGGVVQSVSHDPGDGAA